MATTAQYIPIVGNFDPDAGFSFQNSIGDDVPALSGPGFGPARQGKQMFSIIFTVGGGPVGDDATFNLKVPLPQPVTQQQLNTNFNALLPTGATFYTIAGSLAQDLLLNGLPTIDQVFDLTISWGSPAATPFGIALTLDFGHTVTN